MDDPKEPAADCTDLREFDSPEKEKAVEEIIKEIEEDTSPEVAKTIREKIFMGIMASHSGQRASLPPPESLKIMTDFLTVDGRNNTEIALREIESNERREIRASASEAKGQDHFIWISKVLHCAGILVGVSIIGFAGYLVLNGNQPLGEKIITHGLAFVAGMGVKKMIS